MTSTDPSPASSDRLSLLYHLSQTFNSSLDLDEVLNSVMDEVISVTGAERGFVALLEADGGSIFPVARGMDQKTIDDPQFQVSRSVVERVAREGQPILTSDAQSDERFSMRHSVKVLGLRSILCVPLEIKGKVLGVVYVDNRLQTGLFTEDDLDLLAAIASSAAIAIENARLYQVAVEKGRMERELQMARQVQASLLPQETPQIEGWEFAAHWQPAREVAGDYYDFIPLDGERLSLVIGDVSDKGMSAALFMALTRSIIRASVASTDSPADGIAQANRLICADATRGMFVTMFYALLDPVTGKIAYVNAGHNPPLLCRADKDELETLTRTGMALGVVEDSPFEVRALRLNPGDFILLYTDGVTDATDAHERSFGMDRLRTVVLENRRATVPEIVSALEQAVQDFVGSMAQFDDVAIVLVKCLK
ncbi:MAG: SpoIIE family protein phosphatase [Anaerolineae bacterium]|nr:SpoIIE family protein phosphatase [Anaerolineae bacterium]NIN98059.1 SpoIIE family protein phosphatase [Anaerolineae bacterium]NIQ81002.1 SpoIIE family protein phosphatase [Anaerolineae bacterium]